MNIQELFQKGGPAMWPLIGLSILALTTILERLWFWGSLLSREKAIVNRILDAAARQDWVSALEFAKRSSNQPVGRFLLTPLRLANSDPELFKLALEAAADEELAAMRRGDKILEAVIALSPLLGLLGTVLGLIRSLGNIRLGDIGTASTAGVTLGIAESLITTATGMIVAITALAFYRIFQGLLFSQANLFRRAGNDLELLYRQAWMQGSIHFPRNEDFPSPVVESPSPIATTPIPPTPSPSPSDFSYPPRFTEETDFPTANTNNPETTHPPTQQA